MESVKSITYCFSQDGIPTQKVVGVYAPDKILDGIDELRKTMCGNGRELTKDTKDCCNYYLEFKSEQNGVEYFYTGDFILNEMNL